MVYFFLFPYYKMNQLFLVAVAVVVFCYFGGKYCPSVLKQNKEMLLGVVVGLALCSFMGLRLEGYHRPGHTSEAERLKQAKKMGVQYWDKSEHDTRG